MIGGMTIGSSEQLPSLIFEAWHEPNRRFRRNIPRTHFNKVYLASLARNTIHNFTDVPELLLPFFLKHLLWVYYR